MVLYKCRNISFTEVKNVFLLIKVLRRKVFILFEMGCINFNKNSSLELKFTIL